MDADPIFLSCCSHRLTADFWSNSVDWRGLKNFRIRTSLLSDIVSYESMTLLSDRVVSNTGKKYCNSINNTCWSLQYWHFFIAILQYWYCNTDHYNTSLSAPKINFDFCYCVQLLQNFGLTTDYMIIRNQPNSREKMHDFMAEFSKCVKFHGKFTERVLEIHGPHRRYFEILR